MNSIQVAIYARVSCEQQVSTNTIDSQITALLEQVKADGYTCSKHLQFKDNGFSGSNLIRPALEQLRDAVALGDIDRLYVHSPDRLARKYAYQVVLVDEFSKAGVDVIFLNHPLGQSPEDELLLQVQGMVAEYERAKILERSRRGKRHAAQSGSLNAFSRAPYGYDFISKHLNGGQVRMDVNLTQARHIQQMFEWYVHEHLSVSEICRRLESMSIPSPSGKPKWTVTTVSRMLKNPHYKGCASFGKWRNGQKIDRPRAIRNASSHPKAHSVYRTPPEDWIVVPVTPIIDEALFEAAQEKLEENRTRFRQRKKGPSHLLQGLVVCGLCGYAYIHSNKSSNHRWYQYYQCSPSQKVDGRPWCPNPAIKAQELEEAVWVEVCRLLQNPTHLQQEYQRRLHAADESPAAQTRQHLKSQMRKLHKGIERIIDAYAEGLINKKELEPRLKSMRDRLKVLEVQSQQLKNEEVFDSELKLVIGRLEEFSARVKERLDTLAFLEKREVIRSLVKRVEIFQDRVKVVFKVGNSPLVAREQTAQKKFATLLRTCISVPLISRLNVTPRFKSFSQKPR
ncbi:recombinase family protein (plasmid) [Acaryochloris sp. 'Moss Beach']|uniref:recombinase family protein n=1 Tax=Acaryochloris sp. 'Moss Beach' TaxID=2740837 RepID=UPI001F159457|nr:recombinase family protein [Acaryochloris sp. 'Moss Beach']UJB72700.1 recombinase family protein [Acaryochloris sp. 'Moss Beach']